MRKYGQKCGGKNRKIGLTFYAPKCSKIFFHRKVGKRRSDLKILTLCLLSVLIITDEIVLLLLKRKLKPGQGIKISLILV